MLVRKLSLAFLACAASAITLALAVPAVALPPDIAARAGQHARRAAQERNAVEEIPADAEIADDEAESTEVRQAIGTGAKHPVRRAAYEEQVRSAPRRTARSRPEYAQRASQFGPASGGVRNSFTPSHERFASRTLRGPDRYINAPMDEMHEEEIPMPMGKKITSHQGSSHSHADPIHEEEYYEDDMYHGSGFGPRNFGRNWGDNCNPCCFQLPRLCYFEAFFGAHGFTGPLNRGTGSFGFQEGVNGGLPFFCGTTLQAGVNATQSNFQGAPFTTDDRTQLFTTVGVFRRMDLGLQAGLVFDYLHDDWDYNVDLTQLRGELGWLMPCGNEIGFWFSLGMDETITDAQVPFFGTDSVAFRTSPLQVEPVDIYAFYYRKQFECGGEGRVFGGATDDSRGLLGGNIRLPINPCWQFTTDFTYVVSSDEADFRFNDESWNVSFNLVWTPCGQGTGGCQNYCRPLLDVANNGNFLTRSR